MAPFAISLPPSPWRFEYPARVVSGGQVAATFQWNDVGTVETVFENAGLPGAATGWGNPEENSLIAGIITEVANLGNADFQTTMHAVQNCPNWGSNPRGYQLPASIGNLSTDRGSFQFDDTGLPPAP